MIDIKSIKNKKIGVLMGGISSERSISLMTGKAIRQALTEEGFKVVGIDVDKNIINKFKKEKIDIAFIALHGLYGEDGTIQGLLELLDIPYTGSGVLASALALNKIKAKQIFRFNNILTPDWCVVKKNNKIEIKKQIQKAVKKLKLPLVIKPSHQGSTVGVTIVNKLKDIDKAVAIAFKYGNKIILEEYIPGVEITVGIIGSTPLPVMEIVPKSKFYDYSAKYKRGLCEHIIPAHMPSSYLIKAQKLALQAHQSLGCSGVTRVDLRVEKEGENFNNIYVLEVNTIPGMTKISLLPEAARSIGISFNQLVLEILKLALTERKKI